MIITCGSIGDQVFTRHSLKKPQILKLGKVSCPISKKATDFLKGQDTEDEIKAFAKSFIIENIKVKNIELFLGKTLPCPAKMKGQLLCFELLKDSLDNDLYISIISKDLDLIYNHPNKLVGFHNIGAIENYPYVPSVMSI